MANKMPLSTDLEVENTFYQVDKFANMHNVAQLYKPDEMLDKTTTRNSLQSIRKQKETEEKECLSKANGSE